MEEKDKWLEKEKMEPKLFRCFLNIVANVIVYISFL